MSKVIRSVKNVTKGYSSVQIKVREGVFFLVPGLLRNKAIVHLMTAFSYADDAAPQRRATTHGDRRGLR